VTGDQHAHIIATTLGVAVRPATTSAPCRFVPHMGTFSSMFEGRSGLTVQTETLFASMSDSREV
jgi:hypothetical protein